MRLIAPSSPRTVHRFSGAVLSFLLLATPVAVVAHGGHGDEFHSHEAQSADSIQVDAKTAQRIGLKVEPVMLRRLAFGIKATGQIEALPSRRVEVTYPVGGTIVRLFVQPGDRVKQGQPVAVITSAELAELRVDALDRQVEMSGEVEKAKADLLLAQQTYQQQQQIAHTQIQQAQTELGVAQEQFERDRELMEQGAIPRREYLESEAHLATARNALTEAESRLAVLDAAADLKRAQTAVEVAQDRAKLSTGTYSTRLKQLQTQADPDGTITITAPIAGQIADRPATLGQSAEDAGAALMTIVDDRTVLASANIYEKDLKQVAIGQPVRITVAGMPSRSFQGRVTVMGAVVEGENRVVPVKAEIANSESVLKPGMFAEMEVLTDRSSAPVVAIPSSALVEMNGKSIVYVQNGNAYQPVEVTVGQTSGEWLEIRDGLFEGDRVVTQRATQLYAQSLRGGPPKPESTEPAAPAAPETAEASLVATYGWIIALGGSAIAASTFAAGAWWANRRFKRLLAMQSSSYNSAADPVADPIEQHQSQPINHP
ncbi:efflux RND transporter periplasmic adaptor subunit [Leptolyngbya sp. NK1-12]|uniref:Efflux RND transporter periplasmic adaptor subunit n=1 Tax=Leptolyngbya sp. NK1-12 TaxID=2547451 RepID=A0AA97ALD8_9CYAN|nr:efflux RND transporter periplasmic adaptor subunit [Leptolyngbya sp. NK1-12]WNZ27346.1 efflux RND transporter periplasmic adaptor subunit [Leptolyngbya sp. NK1-12]